MSASSWSDPEWRLGEAPNAYSTKNTSLMFLFSSAPRVWQPAFRVRSLPHHTSEELSFSGGGPDRTPCEIPPGVVLQDVVGKPV